MYFTIALVNPPEPFDEAVILRFLYVFLGPRFNMVVAGSKSKGFIDIVKYSRVPPSIVRCVYRKARDLERELRQFEKVLVMGKDGVDVLDYEVSDCRELAIVIPWSSVELRDVEKVVVKPPVITGITRYDAISLLYSLARCICKVGIDETCSCINWGSCGPMEIKQMMYLARKAIESAIYVDSCTFVEPHALAAVMNKIAIKKSLLVELRSAVMERRIDGCIEIVDLDVVDARNLEFVGSMRILMEGSKINIVCDDEVVERGLSICDSCMCLAPSEGKAVICGEEVSSYSEGVDYGLIRLVGI